ncbi:hypothetical protein DM02DRAFT_526758 [Periconia macrospinosa]|uniref:Cysteine-rich secreted protein n=1 Tax=Periconia macrospinosa TaxID=97972 RepID=A0A2V1DTL1_9PLEO|nr:hypothetical protein DM02DRAFT_526758 [Periconia macrospinosa]
MKLSLFGFLILSLEASRAVGSRLKTKNVPVIEIDADTEILEDIGEIHYKDDPDSPFQETLRCKGARPRLSLSSDKKFATCCQPGQNLLGSKETAFDCCAAGHQVAGSKEVGYRCCPINQIWNGNVCESEAVLCKNGKTMRDGVCVCPSGTKENAEGTCVEQGCTSGIEAGKCYTFTFPNGHRWGFRGDYYAARAEHMDQQWGKFKLCKNEDCTAGGSINPGEGIRIKDVHGNPRNGLYPNQWLHRGLNGDHIRKTPNYPDAGVFTLTKWPCGKYCLGGVEEGLAFACPSTEPAATFVTYDKQPCIPIDVLEVPCDIHARENNCIWKHGSDQCCDKVDCGKASN